MLGFKQPNGHEMNAEHKPEAQADETEEQRLYPEDQAKVDAFVKRGINSVERKPFKPGRLLVILVFIVTVLSLGSQLIAEWAGVY